jgi:hypothetical protein
MGGFLLEINQSDQGQAVTFPVDSKQLVFLISKGYVENPRVDKKDIDDKNKADGLARLHYVHTFKLRSLADLKPGSSPSFKLFGFSQILSLERLKA